MIWLVFSALAGIAILVLLIGGKAVLNEVDPVDHFRAQLSEIDADEAQGTIDAGAAATARLEIQRRILRSASTDNEAEHKAHTFGRLPLGAVVGLAVFVVLASFGLYGLLGAPGAPAAPVSAQTEAKARVIEAGGPTFGEAIEQLQAHLALNPRDMKGWEVLGETARSVGDYALAVEAFSELARMNPAEPEWRVEEFEAHMAHASGQITPAARLVLAALLGTAPEHPAGQFYLGLARLQSGNEDGARAIWTALADRSAADAPWMPIVRQQLSALGVRPPKLSTEDLEVVSEMTTDEREVFIRSMMDRLVNRLESAPDDAEGWMMLARSQLAMGDKNAAIKTLERGILVVSPDKSDELQAFLDNMRENINP